MPGPRQGRRGKRADARPARSRYWSKNHLEQNKVRHLMRSNGMSEDEARKFWYQSRHRFRG